MEAKNNPPSEAPTNWTNRDYLEEEESPKPRRWLVWTATLLSIFALLSGLWTTLGPSGN